MKKTKLSKLEREIQIRFCKENTDCTKINFDKMPDHVLTEFVEAISGIGKQKQILEGMKLSMKLMNF